MSKVFFNLFLMICCYVSANAQYQKRLSFDIVTLWNISTIENIDSQLILLDKKDTFYSEIINNKKKFINIQSEKNGLRESFLREVLSKFSGLDSCNRNIYIVENYRAGERFEAEIYLYQFEFVSRVYTYKLNLGKWELINSKILLQNEVSKRFNISSEYLCNFIYYDESVIITKICNMKVETKAFFFPCSAGFKRIKSLLLALE